jgi:hypothetical protein
MTQLIIGGNALPQTSDDKYKCYQVELGESIRMMSGRLVTEVRGRYWRIEYTYDKLKDDLMRTLLPILRSGNSVDVQFLTPDSDTLQTSTFMCIDKPAPTFAFSADGKGRWHNFTFSLEQVVTT